MAIADGDGLLCVAPTGDGKWHIGVDRPMLAMGCGRPATAEAVRWGGDGEQAKGARTDSSAQYAVVQ